MNVRQIPAREFSSGRRRMGSRYDLVELNMTTLSKILLVFSVIGFVAGSITDFSGFNFNPAWAVALPLGAVFYGLFLISFMLEKEMAKFDKDEEKYEQNSRWHQRG
jgi:hypothetical protein